MIDTTFRQDKIIRETVNLYGDKQYMIVAEEMEEMAELMQVISKYLRINYSGCSDAAKMPKEAVNNIAAEMADVYIMMEELQIMLNIKNGDIHAVINRKLNRQFERNRQTRLRRTKSD